MRDINEPLRIAYAAALTQIGIPVAYQALPNNLNPDDYIVFRSINNVDASTKGSFEFTTTVTVEIHTKGNIGNRGLSADTVADQVFQRVYPSRQSNLSLARGQVYNTEVANDVTQDFRQGNQFGYISRYITFRHLIFVNGSSVGSQVFLNPGVVLVSNFTAGGLEVGWTDTELINKRVVLVSKDGVSFSEILTSGTPTNKQVLYNSSTGTLTFAIPFEPNEKGFALYQQN